DRVAVFSDGKVQQVGTPFEIYERPSSRFVADFVGSSNVVPPEFVERYTGRKLWGSLRPEAILVGRGGDGVAARVTSLSYVGATTRLGLDAAGLRLHATLPAGAVLPEQGEEVRLSFEPSALHVMEAERA
ncbi:polyamine ABC transporter ATP-binding protein, partial [Salmonella enterica subsp. enterica serovar Newport]|nr:polyamine ABC transporter ATP-binding protein [Salmonella enterica subsp. enterica serovar Newport]